MEGKAQEIKIFTREADLDQGRDDVIGQDSLRKCIQAETRMM